MSNGFNVRDFGAVGDGMTNDTAAIRAAFNAALDAGGEVVVPAGTYRTDKAIGFRPSAEASPSEACQRQTKSRRRDDPQPGAVHP